MSASIDPEPESAALPARGESAGGSPFLAVHRSGLLWSLFFSIAAADIFLPGPSFSVFCLPAFFAVLVLVRPRAPWPLAAAAACFLVGAWLLEQGLAPGGGAESLATYRIADRLMISVAIVLVTSIHSRLHRVHDDVTEMDRQKALGRLDPAGEDDLTAMKRAILGLSLVTLAVAFAVDLFTPRNWNLGALYLLPVLWASSLGRPLLLAGFAPVVALLSAAGFLYGPPSSVIPEPANVLLERAITILAVLASGTVLVVYFTRKGKGGSRKG